MEPRWSIKYFRSKRNVFISVIVTFFSYYLNQIMGRHWRLLNYVDESLKVSVDDSVTLFPLTFNIHRITFLYGDGCFSRPFFF